MYRLILTAKRFMMLFGDFAVFQLALVATLLVRYGVNWQSNWNVHEAPFAILSVIWLVTFYINGLYDLTNTRDNISFFRMYLESMIINLAIAFAFFYLIPIFAIAPRTNLMLHFAFALLLGYAWRIFLHRSIAHSIFRNRVLFVGSGADASKVHHLLKSNGLGFELVGVVETSPGTRFTDGEVFWHADLSTIDKITTERSVQTIVLGHRPDDVPGLKEALYKTLFSSVALLDRASLEETVTGRVPLEYVSQTWFLEHLRESEKAWYEGLKRFTDLVLAIPLSVITLVLFPFVALAIALTSKGPVLYSQIRIGKYGQTFRIWKFRTMKQDAEVAGQPQFATADDPRITTVGNLLRKTRIDELPQIWNVIRGDLSMIGPRPERPEFVVQLTTQMPYYALRHLTRPGLTGWAQVRFPYASTLEDNLKKLQFDLYYIKHRSLLLDLAILLKTIGIVLKRQGT